MSIERHPDVYIEEVLASLPENLRQQFLDQPFDARLKQAKEIWEMVHGEDYQEPFYHWVKYPKFLRDRFVAEARPTVHSREELMEPIKPILELSMDVERQRVEACLKERPRADKAFGDDDKFADLPPLPATVRTVRQPYVFGWPITEEWLKTFSNIVGECIVNNHLSNGITQLLARAGCRLFYTCVVHPDAPEWAGESPPPEIPRFYILRICHTLFWDTFIEGRPSDAQYKWLEYVLPGKPGWFRYPLSFEEFDEVLKLAYRPYYICDPFPSCISDVKP
ncbi:hypothetical protein ONZ51_g12744 [Trametes cubensis]|uniref:Uncharacterized protein n=1 Tax=Trametes cubensis TaxID=1111947 RepID=A0AAD7TF82_9APHY|nr:hypothetical protein ONZ51_g12744 [Trametes cubensis]